MNNDLKNWRYILLPGKNPEVNVAKEYAEAFQLWKNVWEKTFKELGESDPLYSDAFSRQTQVGCIFVHDQCIALSFFNDINFDEPTARYDSYFKVWPETAIEKLLKDGTQVTVGSNITVDPEFRGVLFGNVQLKNVILGLSVLRLLDLQFDVMTGTMRCNRGMEKAAYHVGARQLTKGAVIHGCEVDLVGFFRREILSKSGGHYDLITERLWRDREIFHSRMYTPEDNEFHKVRKANGRRS